MRAIWLFAAVAAMASNAALAADKFTVFSASIPKDNKLTNTHVFNGFGCKCENKSPALAWKGAPAGTKSFAVTVYDPDAPTGSGWWHWTVFNIPPSITSLPEGAGSGAGLPTGAVQGRTDFGAAGFGGACPPAGDKPHRYIFKVFALKTDKIDLDNSASGALVGFMLNANKLATASYIARYGR
ncbi:MAG: YbhB/YbcL family Raf kinase inhibitor-like protein [Alphaproteobacteria bacterium]|nr:YbhB/YbcL family Raf kinase inhibitor-like protein [Alphaproteobacteria bacterium]